MSVLSEDETTALIAKASAYDYIRFSWTDLNGIPRGKTVPGRFAKDAIRNGVAEYTGTIALGPRTELPIIKQLKESGFANSSFVPASKIYDLPWAAGGKYKTGQVMCEAFWPNGEMVEATPRTVARKQYEKLAAMGYKLLSGFEAEFIVVNRETRKPVFEGCDFLADLVLAENSTWLFDVEQNLRKCGVDIGAMHTEYSPGQFECGMDPKFGIKTADDMIIFKQAFKEILPQYGLRATFMTRPFPDRGVSSGYHFNHSLWDDQGKCVFYDATKPDRMSDVMRYWVGGIMKHIKALLVLCNPTPNCFRRINRLWCPNQEDWEIDNRLASIRVKTARENYCLVESRLPSSACNPYIVAAATIAAGIDGINNKIEPPPRGIRDTNPSLPHMDEAIEALKADTTIVESLGEEFVDWWVTTKRQMEISKFPKLTFTDNPPEEEIEKERQEYFDFI